MGVGIHRSKIALYIYDKTFEDNDEDKIVDADFIERNMGFYEILDEWKNLINHDVVSELVEPLYDELESFADCIDTTMSVYRVDKVYPEIAFPFVKYFERRQMDFEEMRFRVYCYANNRQGISGQELLIGKYIPIVPGRTIQEHYVDLDMLNKIYSE